MKKHLQKDFTATIGTDINLIFLKEDYFLHMITSLSVVLQLICVINALIPLTQTEAKIFLCSFYTFRYLEYFTLHHLLSFLMLHLLVFSKSQSYFHSYLLGMLCVVYSLLQHNYMYNYSNDFNLYKTKVIGLEISINKLLTTFF